MALDDIQRRFLEGGPADSLADAGLLIHAFDNLEDVRRPWHVCHIGWCKDTDHMSCSIVNARLHKLFMYTAGFILAPSIRFKCGFTADSGAQNRRLGGCINAPRCTTERWWECAWQPDQLRDALATQIRYNRDGYNEYVVTEVEWDEHLPETIEAVWCRDSCKLARRVHASFLQHFNRTALQTPLVRYNGAQGFSII
jgi:hypothetical protein